MNSSKFFNEKAKIGFLILISLSILLIQLASLQLYGKCRSIGKLPYKIKQPGKYCLTKNLRFDGSKGNAINIAASSVTLDLDGYSIQGNASSSNEAIAIHSENQSNLTIRNGTIEGFLIGVLIDSHNDLKQKSEEEASRNITLSNLRLLHNAYRGVRVEAIGCLIKNNYVSQTGGAEITEKDGAIGIETYGPGAMIVKNYVYETKALGERGEAVGISSSFNGQGSIIDSNYISNFEDSPRSIGIWTGTSSNTSDRSKVVISRNTISNMTSSILSSFKDVTFKNNISSNTSKYCRSDRSNYYNDPEEYLATNMST